MPRALRASIALKVKVNNVKLWSVQYNHIIFRAKESTTLVILWNTFLGQCNTTRLVMHISRYQNHGSIFHQLGYFVTSKHMYSTVQLIVCYEMQSLKITTSVGDRCPFSVPIIAVRLLYNHVA